MTSSDPDLPRMIYTGPLPPHLATAEGAEPELLEPLEEGSSVAVVPVILAATAALILGIAIGVFVPPLFRQGPGPAPPRQVAAAPLGDMTPAAPAAKEASPEATAAEVADAPAAPIAPVRAAMLIAPKRVAPLSRASAKPKDGHCPFDGSLADLAVCGDPTIAAADRDMQRAYQRAANAGADADSLRTDQIDWLLRREAAAHRSLTELASAYRLRTAQLNTMAEDPPH